MPNNFRCLISNASGLIFQAVSQYTALDIFWGGLQWLQWQSEIESLCQACIVHPLGNRVIRQGASECPEQHWLKGSNIPSSPASLCLCFCLDVAAKEAKSSKKHSTACNQTEYGMSWFDIGQMPGTHKSHSLTLFCYSWAEERKKNT